MTDKAVAIDKTRELHERLESWTSTLEYYPRLRRVRRLVYDRLPSVPSRAEAAFEASITVTSFSRMFRVRTGTKYETWLRAVRVARAIELIERENVPLKILVHRAGFGSRRAMERAFRDLLGVLPGEYQRQARPLATVRPQLQSAARLAQSDAKTEPRRS